MYALFIFVEFEEVVVLEIILGSLLYPHVLPVKKQTQKGVKWFIPSHMGTSWPSRLVSWILGLGIYHTTTEVLSLVFFLLLFFFIESISKNRIPAEANIGNLGM